MLFNSPLSPGKADRIIESLPSLADDRVVDIGCGTGEFLIRIVEQKGAIGLGIDQDGDLISEAREAASPRVSEDRCTFEEADAKELDLQSETFGLAICLGSTHAFGRGDLAYPNTLDELGRLIRPGGSMLIGEGYWKRDPPSEYLALIGDPVGIYHDHATNISLAENRGLVPFLALTSNEEEWDEFEWSHHRRIEQEAATGSEDPATADRLARRREWTRGYLRWGRSTMGFGFYLFQKPNKGQNKTPQPTP